MNYNIVSINIKSLDCNLEKEKPFHIKVAIFVKGFDHVSEVLENLLDYIWRYKLPFVDMLMFHVRTYSHRHSPAKQFDKISIFHRKKQNKYRTVAVID